jgi:hypothetical protein
MRSTPFKAIPAVILFALLAVSHTFGQSVEWLHASAGFTRNTTAAMDQDGNTIAIGQLHGNAVFGSQSLADTGSYVVKYRDNGSMVWAKPLRNAIAAAVYVTDSGDIYITGSFRGTLQLDTFKSMSKGGSDIFIAHYDSNGHVRKLLSYGGKGNETGAAVALNSRNILIVAGTFDSTLTFGINTLKSSGGRDIFLVTLDTTRKVAMALKAGGEMDDTISAMTLDVYGDIGICGSFHKNFFLGNNSLNSAGGSDMYVMVIDPDGNTLALKGIGGTSDDAALAMTLDATSNIFLTGYFSGTVSFDSLKMTSAGGRDVFITRLDNFGNVKWVQRFGGTGNDQGNDIALDGSYNAHVAGSFENTINFDNSHFLHSAGGSDAFAVQYDILGRFSWGKSFGSTANDVATAIMQDQSDNSIITGSISGSASLDSFSVNGDTAGSFFITRWNQKLSGISSHLQPVDLKVFPNPVNDILNITVSNTQTAVLKLSDLSGRVYFYSNTEMQADRSSYINMSDLQPGIYVLSVTSASGTQNYKLVKL